MKDMTNRSTIYTNIYKNDQKNEGDRSWTPDPEINNWYPDLNSKYYPIELSKKKYEYKGIMTKIDNSKLIIQIW